MVHCTQHITCAVIIALLVGCSSGKQESPDKKLPRPVSVLTLKVTDPSGEERLTGSAGSWKTEELSFEVEGRVQFVIEPETDIDGKVFAYQEVAPATEGDPPEQKEIEISKGRELARIDSTRYELKVESALAQIETARQKHAALRTEIAKVVPAELETAKAELRFQDSELARNLPLVASGAVTRSETERIAANREKAAATIVQIEASKEAKIAELASLEAQVNEARQSWKDAQRDVQECQVFSPFKGQIAAVHVIPGAFVRAGQRVLTVQMMDPIKIELEVAADQSRRLTHKDRVDVVVSLKDGETQHHKAMVYMIDPVADPSTRTFTVTLLMENEKVAAKVPDELRGRPVIRTRDMWPFFAETMRERDIYLTEMKSIHEDDEGAFVWKITNGERTQEDSGRVLDTAKIRVTPGALHFPFLDIWTFRQIAVNPGEDFDPETDRIAGELIMPQGMAAPFDGGKILFDRPQWMVRPGDLVAVNLSGQPITPGFYVPMNVISEQSGEYFVHVVDSAGGGVARKVKVNLFEAVNTSRRIEAAGDGELTEGTQVIAQGTHFIVDGEPVSVAEEVR